MLTYSQSYGTIDYMNKKFSVSSEFFELLHSKYECEVFNSPFPSKTNQKIYYELVDFLKKGSTIISM